MKQNYKTVGQPLRKKDAMGLLLGKPAYVDDLTSKHCLVVKVLRSPHAHALIQSVDAGEARAVPGIVGVYTYEDVPQNRFTNAGQTYPEPSPYDRLILDRRMRFVGDAAAIVAGETERAVDEALKKIKITYEVLEPVLDFRTAKDNPILVHPEDSWRSLCPVGADQHRNLCASEASEEGDPEGVFAQCEEIVEHTWHTKACQQAMMETFRTYTEMDPYGRLHVVSSTQIVFHVRRILANALNIPKSKIHVEKPRIGGGFGAKQTVVAELYPAFVTWKTGRPAQIIYSRKESLIAGSPRHEMEVKVKLGAMKDGTIRALEVYTLSNTGAYGEHGPTTVGLSGHKSIPLYTNNLEAFRFSCDVVYTNVQAAGAYRGYGATQGIFAVESAVNELAERLRLDPVALREKNMVREGQIMPAYFHEPASACALDRCMAQCRETFRWEEKYPVRDMGNGKVRAAGVAMAMQGSGISGIDVGSATVKLSDEGFYNLSIGAADMGTGCDTILAQIMAECMECSLDNIAVFGADSDASPYDSGSYASSTTYVTGKAVENACLQLREKICQIGAELLNTTPDQVSFSGEGVSKLDGTVTVSLAEIATKSMCGNGTAVQATYTHTSPVSPPALHGGHGRSGGGQGDRRRGSVGLHRRGGLRHPHQPQPGQSPGRGRHRPGHRHGPLRKRHLHRRRGDPGKLPHALQTPHPPGHGQAPRLLRPQLRGDRSLRGQVHWGDRHQHPLPRAGPRSLPGHRGLAPGTPHDP